MKKCNPYDLDALKIAATEQVIFSRFPWLRRHRSFVHDCLIWQSETTPRPDTYFRWHLPRLAATLELLEFAVRTSQKRPSILDIATYGPYAVTMERFLKANQLQADWTRTSTSGECIKMQCASDEISVPTHPLYLDGSSQLPFDDQTFDIVLLTEVIEHLMYHPQRTLVEINRVLRPGGFILVTTPNVTSWKKIQMLSRGDWSFDSPTFGSDWGHRYEYSYYNIQQLLRRAGFSSQLEMARDIYLDDPQGIRQSIQFVALAGSKLMSFAIKEAVKLVTRSGSGLLFLWKKVEHISTPPTSEELERI